MLIKHCCFLSFHFLLMIKALLIEQSSCTQVHNYSSQKYFKVTCCNRGMEPSEFDCPYVASKNQPSYRPASLLPQNTVISAGSL